MLEPKRITTGSIKPVINLYEFTRIINTMNKLKGIQYTTELYPNMIHYIIQLPPQVKDMATIVTRFGNFRKNGSW